MKQTVLDVRKIIDEGQYRIGDHEKLISYLSNKNKNYKELIIKLGGEIDLMEIQNLTLGELILRTNKNKYVIKNYGDIITVPEDEIDNIIMSNWRLFNNGAFSINITNIPYFSGIKPNNVLNKEQLDTFGYNDADTIKELFSKMTTLQCETVIAIMVKNMIKGKDYPVQLIIAINDIFNTDIMDKYKSCKWMIEEYNMNYNE
jgi:hypothetical protein